MILKATFEQGEELAADFETDPPMSADFEETTRVASGQYRFGYGLKYDPESMTVSVDAATEVAVGDQRPVTSAAVQVQVGNIEALLQTL